MKALAADIAAASPRPPAKDIDWVTFTGADRRPKRAGLLGKGTTGSGCFGLGLGLSGLGTGLVDGDTDGSTAG